MLKVHENKITQIIRSTAIVVYSPNKVISNLVMRDTTIAVDIMKLHSRSQTTNFSILFILHPPKSFIVFS